MEWKWIKTLLIIIFLCIDVFLGVKVYQNNRDYLLNPEVAQATKDILKNRNISISFELENVVTKRNMRKVVLAGKSEIVEKFIPISADWYWKYKGRRREILPLTSIISLFIRDTDLRDTDLTSIELGYYSELDQIDESILEGEAIPVWRIVAGENTYLYNAYVGSRVE